MKQNKQDKIWRKTCPICGKEIKTLNKKQLEQLYYTHLFACKRKKKQEEKRKRKNK